MSRLLTQTQAFNRQRYITIRERVRQLELKKEKYGINFTQFEQQDLDNLTVQKKRLEVMFMLAKEELPK